MTAPDTHVNVRTERIIAASPGQVFAWLADSRNFGTSPLVARCRWVSPGRDTPFGVGAVRDVFMAAGWFREEITAYEPDQLIRYRVRASFPPVLQEFSQITLTEVDGRTRVLWEVAVEVRIPGVGHLLTRLSAPVARMLYGSILRTADRALARLRA